MSLHIFVKTLKYLRVTILSMLPKKSQTKWLCDDKKELESLPKWVKSPAIK